MNHPSSPPPPATWALILGFALIYISWGTTYLPIRYGVYYEHLPPAMFGGSRVLAAGLVLLVFQLLRTGSVRLCPGDFCAILCVSWLLFVGGNGLINAAGRTVDSSVSAVLAATTPLWLGLFAMCWRHGERLSLRGWLGLLMGLGGVALLLAPSFSTGLWNELGPLFVLGSAASWALGSLVLRHFRLRTPHLTAAAYQMIIGGASLTLLGVLLGEQERLPERVTPGAVAVFLYLLIVGSLVGFVSFNWLLKHVSAAKVGTYAYVNPMVAVLVGWAAGEQITGWLAGGISVILLGVFLIRGGEHAPQLVQVSESADNDLVGRS